MRREYGLLAGVVALAALFGGWWMLSGSESAPRPASAPEARTPSVEATKPPEQTLAAPGSAEEKAPPKPYVEERALSELPPPEQSRRYFAAQKRFDESVAKQRLDQSDIYPTVRDALTTLKADPVLKDGGYMEGVRITQIPTDHPFARAGFRVGDQLMSLDDELLRDPASLPMLLSRLGPVFKACVVRDRQVICEDVDTQVSE